MREWTGQLAQQLSSALQAVKLTQSQQQAGTGQQNVSFPYKFTGAQYLAKGFVEVFTQSPFANFKVSPFVVAMCIRTKNALGQADPDRPSIPVTMLHPAEDDSIVFMKLPATPQPQPLEEYQVVFLTMIYGITGATA